MKSIFPSDGECIITGETSFPYCEKCSITHISPFASLSFPLRLLRLCVKSSLLRANRQNDANIRGSSCPCKYSDACSIYLRYRGGIMRKIILGIVGGVASFLIGVYCSGAVTPTADAPRQIVDEQVYACSLEELKANPDLYDGKFVRMKFEFCPMERVSVANINGRGLFRAVCVDEPTSCQRLFPPEPGRLSCGTDNYPNEIEVDAIGRYTARTADPHPLQRGDKVALLEISKIISAGEWPPKPLIDPGGGSGGGNDNRKGSKTGKRTQQMQG